MENTQQSIVGVCVWSTHITVEKKWPKKAFKLFTIPLCW